MFPAGAPVALTALIPALFPKEAPPRGAARAATDIGDGFAIPERATPTSDQGDGGHDLTTKARRAGAPTRVLRPAFERTITAGFLAEKLGVFRLTDMGEQEFGTLSSAWQEWVVERWADWNPEAAEQLPAALARLARRLFDEQPAGLAPTGAGAGW